MKGRLLLVILSAAAGAGALWCLQALRNGADDRPPLSPQRPVSDPASLDLLRLCIRSGKGDAEAIAQLLERIPALSADRRRYVAYALSMTKVSRKVMPLVRALADHGVKGPSIVDLLERLGDPVEDGERLLPLLQSGDIQDRWPAIDLAGKWRLRAAVPILVDQVRVSDTDPYVGATNINAVRALGKIGDRSVLPLLRRLSKERHRDMNPVYLQAIRDLEQGGRASTVPKPQRRIPWPKRPPRTRIKIDGKTMPIAEGLDILTKRLASHKPTDQEKALFALLRVGDAAKGHPVVGKVRALYESRTTMPRVRVGALLVLVNLAEREEQDRLLAGASRDPSKTMRAVVERVKRDIAKARELGIDRAPTSEELVEAIRSGDPGNRSRALLHIAMRGRAMDKNPAMLEVVRLFVNAPDPSVKASALKTIVRVRGSRANPYLDRAYNSGDLLLRETALRLGKTVGWKPLPRPEVDFPGKERATKQ